MTTWSGLVPVEYGHYLIGEPSSGPTLPAEEGLLSSPGGLFVTTRQAVTTLRVTLHRQDSHALDPSIARLLAALTPVASHRVVTDHVSYLRTWEFAEVAPSTPAVFGPGTWEVTLYTDRIEEASSSTHFLLVQAKDEIALAWRAESQAIARTPERSLMFRASAGSRIRLTWDGAAEPRLSGALSPVRIKPISTGGCVVDHAGTGEWWVESSRQPRLLTDKWLPILQVALPYGPVTLTLDSGSFTPTPPAPLELGPCQMSLLFPDPKSRQPLGESDVWLHFHKG